MAQIFSTCETTVQEKLHSIFSLGRARKEFDDTLPDQIFPLHADVRPAVDLGGLQRVRHALAVRQARSAELEVPHLRQLVRVLSDDVLLEEVVLLMHMNIVTPGPTIAELITIGDQIHRQG